jgi:hypothetical protein
MLIRIVCRIKPLDLPSGVQDSADASKDNALVKPAVMIPAGDGPVTIRPELAVAECPTDDGSDLQSVLGFAEWVALGSMTNVREFACDDWMSYSRGK